METDIGGYDYNYDYDNGGFEHYDDYGSGEGKNSPVFPQQSLHFFSVVPGML